MIDGPPVIGLADALILGNVASATVFVVHAGKTRISTAQQAVGVLERTRNSIGALLTRYDPRASAQGYQYESYLRLRRVATSRPRPTPEAIEALDTAFAVLRNPSLRHALYTRPLPRGIVVLLRIHPGAPGTLVSGCRRFRRAERHACLDAARFYLQQALFFPGGRLSPARGLARQRCGDIARTPSPAAGVLASGSRRRRMGTCYAARVNAAWSQLRDQTRRARPMRPFHQRAHTWRRPGREGGAVAWYGEPCRRRIARAPMVAGDRAGARRVRLHRPVVP